jgi:hypothetical protein
VNLWECVNLSVHFLVINFVFTPDVSLSLFASNVANLGDNLLQNFGSEATVCGRMMMMENTQIFVP